MAVGCVVCADDAEDGGLSLGSRERVGEEVNMVLVVVECSDEGDDEGDTLAEEPNSMREN